MNEDYLWDKSGDADAETAQLERTLGRLGFKPSAHSLPLPVHARPVGWYRKNFSQTLAIAATLVILLLAGGLWLGLRRSSSDNSKLVAETIPEVKPSANDFSGPRPPIGPIDPTGSSAIAEQHQPKSSTSNGAAATTTTTARNKFKNRAAAERRRELIAMKVAATEARARREQLAREGEAAKAQLIKALHITSDALNAVQKKIQGEQERRPIS